MPKTLKILSITLLCLAVVFALARFVTMPAADKTVFFKDAVKARRIVVTSSGVSADIVKTGDKWELRSPLKLEADKTIVDGALEALSRASMSEVLATDSSRHAGFGLTDAEAIRFQAFMTGNSADPAIDILVGKGGTDYDSVFVRKYGNNDVREGRGLSRDKFDRKAAGWADKTICRIDAGSVRQLEIRGGAGLISVKKEGPDWHYGSSGSLISTRAVSEAVHPMLDALSDFKADELIAAAEAPASTARNLKKPATHLLVRYTDKAAAKERVLELDITDKEPDSMRSVVKKGAEALIYRVSDWRLNPFRRKAADFLKS